MNGVAKGLARLRETMTHCGKMTIVFLLLHLHLRDAAAAARGGSQFAVPHSYLVCDRSAMGLWREAASLTDHPF